jgi:SAM-dependent methyltransferase
MVLRRDPRSKKFHFLSREMVANALDRLGFELVRCVEARDLDFVAKKVRPSFVRLAAPARSEGLHPEYAWLQERLAASENDREARFTVIHAQALEIARMEGLRADVAHLAGQLEVSERNRAERLAVIHRQADELARIGGLEADIEHLKGRLVEAEPLLAAREAVIERQAAELAALRTEDPYDIAYRWGWSTPHLRDLVRACYKGPDNEDNARRYAASEEFLEAARLLADLGLGPVAGRRILDVGCGNGIACHALARAGYSVDGIDASRGAIAGLKAAAAIRCLDGAPFQVVLGHAGRLPFRDEAFDGLWMREVAHHFADLPALLMEARRVLKPDGLLCCLREVVIWNEGQRAHFFAHHPFHHITRDEGCYYLEEYLAAFGGAGFEVARILDPVESIVNTYPEPCPPGSVFDARRASDRAEGYDLFSFFLRKRR